VRFLTWRRRHEPNLTPIKTIDVAMEAASVTAAEMRTSRRGATGEVRIGTSGWHYDSWWGPFFPDDVRKKDALRYYASRFNTTELNAPFYRTPTLDAVKGWFDQTPEDFRFAWKASRFITHWKRLSEHSWNSLELLETRLAVLGHKAGPVLFQLPPHMPADRDRLASFMKMLNPARRYSFEFRHPSWYEPAILALLEDHDASLCLSDHAAAPAPWQATAGWVYIRGHGPTGRYHGNYSEETLASWARDIRDWQRHGRDVWCFFDNDVKSAAPADAERLLRRVAGA
jgi:uncharacterized protein YecE (DUF72 family)